MGGGEKVHLSLAFEIGQIKKFAVSLSVMGLNLQGGFALQLSIDFSVSIEALQSVLT